MTFLISLCLALLVSVACSDLLKKKPVPFYIGATVIAVLAIIVNWAGISLPEWVNSWIIPVFARGGLTGAFFVIVMFTGAFPDRSLGTKTFLPIRGQLSIIASILGIGHCLAYSKSYVNMMGKGASDLKISMIFFIIASTLMFVIMIPLFITSFITIRKKMKGATWKKLQRLAYVFYGLLFVHVMMLMVPKALRGQAGYDLTVFVYSFVFLSYLICKLLKVYSKKTSELLPKRQLIGIASSIFVATITVAVINSQVEADVVSYTNTAIVSKYDMAEDEAKEASKVADKPLKDGTYTGEGMGNNGTIAVEVTITDGKPSDIVITKFVDDKEYFDVETDGEEMISRVLEAGSGDVDTIAGATYSSEGFISAVNAAFEAARQ